MNARLQRIMLQKDLAAADRRISEAERRVARRTAAIGHDLGTDDGSVWMLQQSLLAKRKHRREILRSQSQDGRRRRS
jgi:hypothetical protein